MKQVQPQLHLNKIFWKTGAVVYFFTFELNVCGILTKLRLRYTLRVLLRVVSGNSDERVALIMVTRTSTNVKRRMMPGTQNRDGLDGQKVKQIEALTDTLYRNSFRGVVYKFIIKD